MSTDEWLTAKEAMDFLKLSKSTFYKLVRERRITAYEIDGTDEKRYRRGDLDKLFKPAKEDNPGTD